MPVMGQWERERALTKNRHCPGHKGWRARAKREVFWKAGKIRMLRQGRGAQSESNLNFKGLTGLSENVYET